MDISVAGLSNSLELPEHQDRADNGYSDETKFQIEQKKDEVLAVVETNTVVDPGTVMVHVEYAFAAC